MDASPFTGPVYLDTVLTPNRSLSDRGFNLIMALIGAASLVVGLAFLSMGALPVIGFFGLDVLAIWLAFRWHRRSQQERTRVRITAETLDLHHVFANGREKRAQIPSAFARIELDEPALPRSDLRIEHGRTAFVIGRFLTPKQRQALAATLREALRRAQAERHPA